MAVTDVNDTGKKTRHYRKDPVTREMVVDDRPSWFDGIFEKMRERFSNLRRKAAGSMPTISQFRGTQGEEKTIQDLDLGATSERPTTIPSVPKMPSPVEKAGSQCSNTSHRQIVTDGNCAIGCNAASTCRLPALMDETENGPGETVTTLKAEVESSSPDALVLEVDGCVDGKPDTDVKASKVAVDAAIDDFIAKHGMIKGFGECDNPRIVKGARDTISLYLEEHPDGNVPEEKIEQIRSRLSDKGHEMDEWETYVQNQSKNRPAGYKDPFESRAYKSDYSSTELGKQVDRYIAENGLTKEYTDLSRKAIENTDGNGPVGAKSDGSFRYRAEIAKKVKAQNKPIQFRKPETSGTPATPHDGMRIAAALKP